MSPLTDVVAQIEAARDSSSPAEASFKSTASSSLDELGPMTPKEAPPPKEASADATAGQHVCACFESCCSHSR